MDTIHNKDILKKKKTPLTIILVTDIVLAFCIQLIVLSWSLFRFSDLFS